MAQLPVASPGARVPRAPRWSPDTFQLSRTGGPGSPCGGSGDPMERAPEAPPSPRVQTSRAREGTGPDGGEAPTPVAHTPPAGPQTPPLAQTPNPRPASRPAPAAPPPPRAASRPQLPAGAAGSGRPPRAPPLRPVRRPPPPPLPPSPSHLPTHPAGPLPSACSGS